MDLRRRERQIFGVSNASVAAVSTKYSFPQTDVLIIIDPLLWKSGIVFGTTTKGFNQDVRARIFTN